MDRGAPDRPRSRISQVTRGLLLLAVVAALAAHAIGGWIVSSWIGETFLEPRLADNVADGAVMRVSGDQVTIRMFSTGDDDLTAPGVIGFKAGTDYLRLGEVVAVSGDDVTRTFELVRGSSPAMGESGSIDRTGDEPTRLRAKLGVIETSYSGPLGDMDAWLIEGSSTWVIHVHDRSFGLDQTLRMMNLLDAEGFSQMAITYRNDPGQPGDPSGIGHFGVTERNDLESAIAHARASGASTVFLVGYGSGGAIVLAETYRDQSIAGVILDGPVLHAESALRHVASQVEGLIGRMPRSVLAVGTVVASLRHGISWETTDYLARAELLVEPTLVLHGTDDAQSPISDSRLLADTRREVVTLVEIAGAGSDSAWNLDPATYSAAVLSFLDRVRAGG